MRLLVVLVQGFPSFKIERLIEEVWESNGVIWTSPVSWASPDSLTPKSEDVTGSHTAHRGRYHPLNAYIGAVPDLLRSPCHRCDLLVVNVDDPCSNVWKKRGS
jgi:hypothetical protein